MNSLRAEAMRVLVVDDDAAIRSSLKSALEEQGYCVDCCSDGEQALALLFDSQCTPLTDVVITDLQMQPMDGAALLQAIRQRSADLPVIMMSAHADTAIVVSAMRHGVTHVLDKPFRLKQLLACLARIDARSTERERPVSEDPLSQVCVALCERVANTQATILITGPSGVGKEVYARYVHDCSARSKAPFVAVNCAAIPETMLEGLLFGHEKGAFTGADRKHIGKFQQAQGGSILLDEVSEMPLALQAKLLRVLQEKQIEPLGSQDSIALDVRVMATSNRNLEVEVREGRFRQDLYYRLNVIPLMIPALAQRPDDILPLAEQLLKRYPRNGMSLTLSESAKQSLCDYSWPGNVRELDNCLQRASIVAVGEEIQTSDCFPLQAVLQEQPAALNAPVMSTSAQLADAPVADLASRQKQQERALIEQVIRSTRTREEAAKQLGISPRTLRYKLAQWKQVAESNIAKSLNEPVDMGAAS